MGKSQYELVRKVLQKLQDHGVLSGIILAGSWSVYFYRHYFNSEGYISAIRTTDIDFLVPLPYKPAKKANVVQIMQELNFEAEFVGRRGLIKLRNPELTIEFLVPEKGRGSEKPIMFKDLGINAQPLRYLNMLTDDLIDVNADGLRLKLPHPAAYALHKFIIFKKRRKTYKAERDFETAKRVFVQMVESGRTDGILRVFNRMHPKWRKTIVSNLEKERQAEIVNVLKGL